MSLQSKVTAVLAQLPPGKYPTKALAALLKENGAINWGTNWVSVKNIINIQPNWHWNGEKSASKSRWIKNAPDPVCPGIRPQPEPDPDEIPKGPVSTALFRMESMLEALCNSMGIVERPMPADIAKELSRINETPCRNALIMIFHELDAFAKQNTHYIKKQKLAVWLGTIRTALGK